MKKYFFISSAILIIGLTMFKLCSASPGARYFPEIKQILSQHFDKEIDIVSSVQLSEKERRNLILRIEFKGKTEQLSQTLIFKESVPDVEDKDEDDKEIFGRFCRDWAGLEFMSTEDQAQSITPRFYGGSVPNRFVLLEDLGQNHISLVDSLTGYNRQEAESALTRFVTSLAKFHAFGIGRTDVYAAILKRLNENAETWQEDYKTQKEEAHQFIIRALNKLEIKAPAAFDEELDLIFKNSLEPGAFTTLVHGDICPDNVFDNPVKNKLHIIDFEWSVVKNAMLDATYLRMSMPTCWCAKAFPPTLIDSLEVLYRQELEKNLSKAFDDDVYYNAYTLACGQWALTAFMNAGGVLDEDFNMGTGPIPVGNRWNKDANLARPRVLSRLKAFIEVSLKYNKLPELRSIAEKVLAKITERWVDSKPLDLYPVFVD
ncbi:MAG: phosphotransferase [Alphaproteobacteria bacterium]|nr:phosphotransferase [Alphaproteobacteria bacterium]